MPDIVGMAVRLLSSKGSAVSATSASILSRRPPHSPSRPATPLLSGRLRIPTGSSSAGSPLPTESGKVLCVRGATNNDGKPMVECLECKTGRTCNAYI